MCRAWRSRRRFYAPRRREALERYRRTLGEANSNTDACLELVDRHAEGLERVSQGDSFYSDDEEEEEVVEEDDDEDDE